MSLKGFGVRLSFFSDLTLWDLSFGIIVFLNVWHPVSLISLAIPTKFGISPLQFLLLHGTVLSVHGYIVWSVAKYVKYIGGME